MQAILRIVTEQDLRDYVSGRLDEDGRGAVFQLMNEDRSVRNLISQISEQSRSSAFSDAGHAQNTSKNN
ncbi:MAG: hypothetical protein RIC29_06570 [Rhodospirillaceae bacterium]